MDNPFEEGLSTNQTAAIIFGAMVLVIGIIGATHQGVFTVRGAGLVMDGVLTIGTLGYVFLTYSMVSQMRRDIEVRERHQFRPVIIELLEEELLPLRDDILRTRQVIRDGEPGWNGPDGTVIDGSVYPSYHEIKPGYNTRNIPRFTSHLDLDNGQTFDVYQSADEYHDAYQEAVRELQQLILQELDGFNGTSDQVRDFAVLALKVDDDGSNSSWDNWKEEIVPLRDEIPSVMSKLGDSQHDVKTACSETLREIDRVLNETLNEYDINEAELDADSPP
jgi:hypothetical protein